MYFVFNYLIFLNLDYDNSKLLNIIKTNKNLIFILNYSYSVSSPPTINFQI